VNDAREGVARRNCRAFVAFRVFFTARFYYPIYTLLFLDHGLTLEQFGLLNGVWAATIVLLELPSGALADVVGRRNLVVGAATLMASEMLVLMLAPPGGGAWLFALFLLNRVLSGAAEAAASGADEALAYDSLKAAGREGQWGRVLERASRYQSLGFFVALLVGAAVYDPGLVERLGGWFGADWQLAQRDVLKFPVILNATTSLVAVAAALGMREARPNRPETPDHAGAAAPSALERLKDGWARTRSGGAWIWTTAFPFAVVSAAMVIDSSIRQFMTLASEYYRVIELPVASFGVVGSGFAVVGFFVPSLARRMAGRFSARTNFAVTAALVFAGFGGVSLAIPRFGVIPAAALFAAIQLTHYFVSRYLNEAAPSDQRATILSFRGLAINIAYGGVSLAYAGLIAGIKATGSVERGADASDAAFQRAVFVEALAWFPWYFLITALLCAVVVRHRFGRKRRGR